MIIAFYKVGNSLNYERHTFDNLFDQPEKILEMLNKLSEEEVRIYEVDKYDLQSKTTNLADFEQDFNDEMLDNGWWNVVLQCSLSADVVSTEGMLSIFASIIRNEHIESIWLLDFILSWKKKGHFESFVVDSVKELDNIRTKTNLTETIIAECMKSKDMRIDLQRHFGQFDGAQICCNCGKVVWGCYSWDGTTYCDLPCVLNGECISEKYAKALLKDAEDPDCPYYWTEFS